jgi:hypothetical protein
MCLALGPILSINSIDIIDMVAALVKQIPNFFFRGQGDGRLAARKAFLGRV